MQADGAFVVSGLGIFALKLCGPFRIAAIEATCLEKCFQGLSWCVDLMHVCDPYANVVRNLLSRPTKHVSYK